MNILVKNKLFVILTCLIMLSSLACRNKKRETVIFTEPQSNEIKMEIDSINFPPETTMFPIRVKITNYAKNKVLLTFKKIYNEYRYQKQNLFMVSGKDTLILGINDDYLILDKMSVTSFNLIGFYNFKKDNVKFLFDNFNKFPAGKIIYNNYNEQLKRINKKDLIGDTLLVPTHLEASTSKATITAKFLDGSNYKKTIPL